MATKKKAAPKVVAKLEIICTSNNECDLKFKGETEDMISALASLMMVDEKENHFRDMMVIAIEVALEAGKKAKSTATKKKAVIKKKKA